MNKRILLPLQSGDKVVRCPKCTSANGRGDIGKVTNVVDNLTVQVIWEEHFSVPYPPGGYPQTERAYCIRKESRCHHCVHRMKHLSGQACPTSWKEVKTIDESVSEQPAVDVEGKAVPSESASLSTES